MQNAIIFNIIVVVVIIILFLYYYYYYSEYHHYYYHCFYDKHLLTLNMFSSWRVRLSGPGEFRRAAQRHRALQLCILILR